MSHDNGACRTSVSVLLRRRMGGGTTGEREEGVGKRWLACPTVTADERESHAASECG